MKNFILKTMLLLAIFILLVDMGEVTFKIVLLKVISLLFIWMVAKANNYFYKEN